MKLKFMKRKLFFTIGTMLVLLASCQSVAEKTSGKYTGPYSSTGLTNNTGNGTITLTPDGQKRVDMVFDSPGNVNININDVDITDIVGQYFFNLADDMGGTASITNGVIASGNVLALDYADTTYTLSLAGFGKQ